MSEHTPGPWRATEPESGNDHWFGNGKEIRVETSGGRDVCISEGDTPEDIANARLIAAAPDLLAALESLHERLYCLCETGDLDHCEAFAAIAKAKGEVS